MQSMSMPVLLFIEAFFSNVINSTVLPLRETEECPTNETSWMKSSADYNCSYPQEYHCLPTLFLNGSVQGCLNVTEILPGFCTIYNPFFETARTDDKSECDQINEFNCPNEFYKSNKIYLYPSCQKINPVEKCYLGNPNCPNITSTTLRDPSTISGTDGTSDARKLFLLNGICPTMCISIITIEIICRRILPF